MHHKLLKSQNPILGSIHLRVTRSRNPRVPFLYPYFLNIFFMPVQPSAPRATRRDGYQSAAGDVGVWGLSLECKCRNLS